MLEEIKTVDIITGNLIGNDSSIDAYLLFGSMLKSGIMCDNFMNLI